MRAPDNDAGEAAVLRFKCGKIADTTFIQPATVIDHEDGTGLRRVHRFEKDIDTSVMSDRKSRASESLTGDHWTNSGRSNAQGSLESQTSVRQQWSRKVGEGICEGGG